MEMPVSKKELHRVQRSQNFASKVVTKNNQ